MNQNIKVKEFKNAAFWGWMSKLSQVMSGVIVIPLIVGKLGVYEYTKYTYILSILAISAYFDFGIPNAVTKIFSKYKNSQINRFEEVVIVTSNKILKNIGFIVFICLMVIFTWHEEISDNTFANSILLLSIAIYCSSFPFRIYAPYLVVSGKIVLIDKITIFVSIIRLIIIFMYTEYFQVEVVFLVLIYSVFELVTSFFSYKLSKLKTNFTNEGGIKFSYKHAKYILSFGSSTSFLGALSGLLLNLPIVIMHNTGNQESYVAAYSIFLLITINFFAFMARYQVLLLPVSVAKSNDSRSLVISLLIKYISICLILSLVFYITFQANIISNFLLNMMNIKNIERQFEFVFAVMFPAYIFFLLTSSFRSVVVFNARKLPVYLILIFSIFFGSLGLYCVLGSESKLRVYACLLFLASLLTLYASKYYYSAPGLDVKIFIFALSICGFYGINFFMNPGLL